MVTLCVRSANNQQPAIWVPNVKGPRPQRHRDVSQNLVEFEIGPATSLTPRCSRTTKVISPIIKRIAARGFCRTRGCTARCWVRVRAWQGSRQCGSVHQRQGAGQMRTAPASARSRCAWSSIHCLSIVARHGKQDRAFWPTCHPATPSLTLGEQQISSERIGRFRIA